ncbi:nuclear transport factor 2 family protein [Hymenobacter terricola]|uniref:nuclear transport factor 2 family protein n=1 Tax=Hymenobacter terricola TaxID=2819236 RepID=UPI001B301AE0|nr:nuclear transport factor 2 family protein [Hymenobacter terricola]
MDNQPATDTRSLLGGFFQRLGLWDADGVAALFADEIDWYVPAIGGLPWGGRRSRREQVPEYFKTLWAHIYPEQTKVSLDNLIVEGEEAVALGSFSQVSNTTELAYTTPFAMHLTVQEGRIVRLHLYEDTYAVGRAYGV